MKKNHTIWLISLGLAAVIAYGLYQRAQAQAAGQAVSTVVDDVLSFIPNLISALSA